MNKLHSITPGKQKCVSLPSTGEPEAQGHEEVMPSSHSVVVKDDADITPGREGGQTWFFSFFRFTVGGIMSFLCLGFRERRVSSLGRGGGVSTVGGKQKDFPRGEEELREQ